MRMKNLLNKFFHFYGIVIVITAILFFPDVAIYWRSNIINYYDAMMDYSKFSFLIGLFFIIIGISIRKTKNEFYINFSLLLFIISIFFLADRMLLAKFGYGLWQYDYDLHFEHRPNTILSWGEDYQNKLIQINSNGYHDDEFNFKKENDEIRIFMIGNSITMGHGVEKNETFSNQLENLYNNRFINVFNLGVQGYSTSQELEVLKRNIGFSPDILFIGFCLNDITEPIEVNKNFGGSGYDYHKIYQASDIISGYLINNTGFGKLLSKLKFSDEINNAKEKELNAVKKLSRDPFYNKKIENSWINNFENILKIKNLTSELSIKFYVLIFPYTFQLFNHNLKGPQRILRSFLEKNKINYIDFTHVFENIISQENISKDHVEQTIQMYYLDEDHFNPLGHQLVAQTIRDFLASQINTFNCLSKN